MFVDKVRNNKGDFGKLMIEATGGFKSFVYLKNLLILG